MDLTFKIEDISACEKQLEVEIAAEEVRREFDEFYRNLKPKASIRGFRKGRIPRSYLEKFFRNEAQKEVTEHLIEHSFNQVIGETKLHLLFHDVVEIPERISPDRPFTYRLKVEVPPPVELRQYTGFHLTCISEAVTEEDIERAINSLRERNASFHPVEEDRPVEKGDLVVLDYKGKIDGEPLRWGEADNLEVVVGDGVLDPPELEAKLVGLRRGVPTTVEVTLPPEDYPEELGGRTATFEVEIHEIKEVQLPPLDDEFAQEIGEETVEDLKRYLRETLEAKRKRKKEADLRAAAIKELVKANPIDLPPKFLARIVEEEKERMRRMLSYLSGGHDTDPVGFEEVFGDEIEARKEKVTLEVAANFLTKAIAEAEGIEVSDEEFDAYVSEMAKDSHRPKELVMRQIEERREREEVLHQIRHRKVLDFIVEHSHIEEKEPEPEPEPEIDPEPEEPSRIILP